METVTIDGVEYVKASVLAKKYRYTNDYIGQLCRGKKVDAHLVGRTWYVYPPSLDGHKSTRYAELRAAEKSQDRALETSSSRVLVEAPMKKSVFKSQKPHFHDRVFWKPTAYEPDAAELMPTAGAKAETRSLKMPINLAESERVRVASVSKNVSMVSQPLPAIALSGTLKVQDFSPDFTVSDEPLSENNVEKYSDSGSTDQAKTNVETVALSEHEPSPEPSHGFLRRLEAKSAKVATQPVRPRSASDVRPVTPDSGEISEDSEPELRIQRQVLTSEDPRTSLFFKLVIAPAVTLLVMAVAATLLAVENVTVVGGGEQVASLRFDSSFLTAFFTSW